MQTDDLPRELRAVARRIKGTANIVTVEEAADEIERLRLQRNLLLEHCEDRVRETGEFARVHREEVNKNG